MLFTDEKTFNPQVLVVDDEPINCLLLEEALKDIATVASCLSGEDAVELALEKHFHVILLDIEMAGMNGFEVCKKLKNDPRTCHSSVIFVTSHSESKTEYQSFQAGGIDFLNKPVDFRLCQMRVRNHLQMQQQNLALTNARQDIHDIVSQIPVFVAYFSADLQCRYCNDFSGAWFDLPAEEMMGKSAQVFFPGDFYIELISHLQNAENGAKFDLPLKGANPEISWVKVNLSARTDKEVVSGYLLTITDISHLKTTQQLLETERERLQVTLNSIGDAVIAVDEQEKVTFMNPIAERMTGWILREAKGQPIQEIMHLCDATSKSRHVNPATMALKEKRTVAMALNCQLVSRTGQIYRVEDSAAPIKDKNNNILGSIIVFHDVSESVAMAVKMSHLANHDQLTDLPNRILLHDRIHQACRVAEVQNKSIALFLIDIDHFKYLNDTLGHQQGDLIIKQVAKRLESLIDPNSTLARIGGDEFVLLLPDLNSSGLADSIASDIVSVIQQPFRIDGDEFSLSVSVGISLCPEDSTSPEQLMSHADAAMYKAKEQGRNRYCFYSDEMEAALQQRHEILNLLRSAIEQDTLEVHFQPKFDLNTNDITGAEALVRLRGEDNNLVSPADFIPLAEETGLIVGLGKQVLYKSCAAAKRWVNAGNPLKVAVNVAAQQFNTANFCEEIAEVLEETGLLSRYLELEVTESALMQDYETTRETLSNLSKLGLTVAIDDFGTGYSSLSYLKFFPLDVLKIDQSFVRDMLDDEQSLDIVKAVVRLAQSLNLSLVGEGIEEHAQQAKLLELGCLQGQGYVFSRPLPLNEFEALLLANT